VAISAPIRNSGCGPTCVLSSRLVDRLEPQLKANRDAYLAGSRTQAEQTAAAAVFDGAWAWLSSFDACGSPDLGDAGRRCLSDRARGGKWDWFALYRDPIANDPAVQLSPIASAAAFTGIPQAWLIAAAAALLLGVIL
jgi:hypothetical protein